MLKTPLDRIQERISRPPRSAGQPVSRASRGILENLRSTIHGGLGARSCIQDPKVFSACDYHGYLMQLCSFVSVAMGSWWLLGWS